MNELQTLGNKKIFKYRTFCRNETYAKLRTTQKLGQIAMEGAVKCATTAYYDEKRLISRIATQNSNPRTRSS